MDPVVRITQALTVLLRRLSTLDHGGEDGYTLETVLIVSGLAALAIAVVAGVGVAVHHYLSTIH